MLVNKSCKTSIVQPFPDYIQRITQYLPYRTETSENVRKAIFPKLQKRRRSSVYHSQKIHPIEMNVQAIILAITGSSLLDGSTRGLPYS